MEKIFIGLICGLAISQIIIGINCLILKKEIERLKRNTKQLTPWAGFIKPKNNMREINLGDKVRSNVSGFSGTVTAKCEYLHGSTTYCVTAPEPVSGEVKTEWFCVSELVIN